MSYQGFHLLQKLQHIKTAKEYVGVHLHLSSLLPVNRQSHYIRIATTTFDPITVRNPTAMTFLLQNKDIIFLGQRIDRKELHDTLHKVRYLFGDDPLTKDESKFFTIYNLDASFFKFEELAKKIYETEGGANNESPEQIDDIKRSITTKMLAALETAVQKTDVTTLLRSKPVCTVIKNIAPQVVFYEKKIFVKDFIEMVAPNVEPHADRWIFQYLKEMLNERAIYLLGQSSSIEVEGTFSINLTVKTVLSHVFQNFDRHLPEGYIRENVVVELAFLDCIYSYEDYRLARDLLRQKGYRSCITGIQPGILSIFDPKQLDSDFVKISWDTTAVKAHMQSFVKALQNAIKSFGALNVIMAECNSEESLLFGQQLGLYLFQGKFIDKLMSSVAKYPFQKQKAE